MESGKRWETRPFRSGIGYTRAMAETWPIFFLAVVLKVPAIGMIWLVLWAAKAHDPGAEAAGGDDDGGSRRDKLPLWPRRGGPHSGPGGSIDCRDGSDGRRRQAVAGMRPRDLRRSRETSRR